MTTQIDPTADGTDPRSIPLPEAIGERARTAFGFADRPETFGEWWERLVETFESDLDRSVTADDLCSVDESPHSATVAGETTHYACAQDPLVVGLLADEPVVVRSEPPTGDDPVTIRFGAAGGASGGNRIEVEPEGAVLSFGIDEAVAPLDGPVTPETVYGLVCPHGHAFPDREAYERWAADAEAVTTPLSVPEGLAVTSVLIDVAGVEALG